MGLKFVNNSEALINAPGIGASDTINLPLQAGQGARFPTIVAGTGDFFYATLVDVSGNREVIKVTEHQLGTDLFQAYVRKVDAIQNGAATSYAFASGDKVQARVPAIAILSPDGTKSDYFQIGTDTTGITLKHDTQELWVRNLADSTYANIKAAGLTLSGALAMVGTITGVTSMVMSAGLSGVTTIAMAGALSGVTTLAMAGALSGATSITMAGALTGATTGAFSSNVTIGGTLGVTGKITAATASAIAIDNESAAYKIKARDHGTNTSPEVVNVVYGTGSPPAASGVPEGTIFFKYV